MAKEPKLSKRSLITAASVVLVATLSATLLTGCGPGAGGATPGAATSTTNGPNTTVTYLKNTSMNTIQARGKILVGVDFNAAPFASKDPSLGTPVGIDIDLVKSIATTLFGNNLENRIVYVPIDPRDRELAIEQNKVDIAVGRYPISVARKQFVDFAGPYAQSEQTILINSKSQQSRSAATISGIADLNGKKVCVVNGSTDVAAFKALAPNADTSVVKASVAECGAELLAGNVAAIAADHVDELKLVGNTSALTLLKGSYGTQLYGIGLAKGNQAFRQFLNDQIDKWNYPTAYDKYVEDPASPARPTVDRY